MGRASVGCYAPRHATMRAGLLAVAVMLGFTGVATAQTAKPVLPARVTTEHHGGDSTPEQRNAMYEQLAREVSEFERQHRILKTVVKLAGPTVVHIEAETNDSVGRVRRKVHEAGSGVVIELKDNFYALTNRHVVRDAKMSDVQVKLADGRVVHPTKVWGDPDTDIAVLEIKQPNLIAARIGNSDIVEIGDMVLAVGSPFGLSHSVTSGIISAKGRRDLDLGDGGVRFQDFMQTDAAINPGNSGGPLINLRGEVVGINTAIASNSGGNEGIGFSIPINMVMVVAKQLIERGVVSRAYLGVRLDSKFSPAQAVEMGLPRLAGARLLRIEPNSPAETAELQAGDVVLQFNNVRIENDTHLVNVVGLTEVDTEVPIVIFRNRQATTLKVRVGNAAAPAAQR